MKRLISSSENTANANNLSATDCATNNIIFKNKSNEKTKKLPSCILCIENIIDLCEQDIDLFNRGQISVAQYELSKSKLYQCRQELKAVLDNRKKNNIK